MAGHFQSPFSLVSRGSITARENGPCLSAIILTNIAIAIECVIFYNLLSSLCCVLFTKKIKTFSMTNTTFEAVNIKTALSFRPGRCVEVNLYHKLLYLTIEL